VPSRELVVLGTASQVPTRTRNHNGYFLRWDDEGVLFDPGEGTQRQMLLAGVPASAVTRICVTHFHGDHCLGLPGVLQRMSLDGVLRPVRVAFPASGAAYVERLRRASIFNDRLELLLQAVDVGVGDVEEIGSVDGIGVGRGVNGEGPESTVVTVEETASWTLGAARLHHPVDTLGWRLEEHAGRSMLPRRLAEAGVSGADVGRLQREGAITVDGRHVTLEQMSVERRGQVVSFVMDTAWCDGALALAQGADLLVCEATFASAESELAAVYGHLTAAQAGRLAAEAGVRRLLLTHFSQRYPDVGHLVEEAASAFRGEILAAADLQRVEVPRRQPPEE
jgi:ribonuclease Z